MIQYNSMNQTHYQTTVQLLSILYANHHISSFPIPGAAVNKPGVAAMTFRYPSYVQTIMGSVMVTYGWRAENQSQGFI